MKPLYLARILLERTDENNIMTAQELVNALSAYNIPANRKSIYDDIDALREFGLDIALIPGRNGGYFVASRDFELPELKLLVDAVQSSGLITGKKSKTLIGKLSKLTSISQAGQLNRQVHVAGRAKTLNEAVYYNIDAIFTAINDRRKISFKYFDYNAKKQRVYRRDGENYIRTPIAICWDDDNYYLITYSSKYEYPLTNFRVDRMIGTKVLDEKADSFDFKKFSIAEYTKQTFGMYNGEKVRAHLAFNESLVNAVIDHFGSDIQLSSLKDGRFSVTVEVSASPVFLAWIFQFGKQAEILAPESLRQTMKDMIRSGNDMYC
jgi:predicted DNA-binding transcriptional regulator YafY